MKAFKNAKEENIDSFKIKDSLAKFQWFDDSKHVLLSSQLDNEEHFYIVDVQTHELKLISPFGKNIKNLHSILAINKINNNILFTSTNFKNMIELNILTSLNQLVIKFYIIFRFKAT